MKAYTVTLVTLVVLICRLVGVGEQRSYAQGTNRFSINGADGVLTVGFVAEKAGWSLPAHLSHWAADGSVMYPLLAPSQVPRSIKPHIAHWFADDKLHVVLVQPSALKRTVARHIAHWFADGARPFPIAYPTTMINDQVPPVISPVTTMPDRTGSSLLFSWSTDEPAQSTVALGTTAGAFTITLTDGDYKTRHSFVIQELTVGTTYFYRLTSIDRSGQTQTKDGSALLEEPGMEIYLPVIIR